VVDFKIIQLDLVKKDLLLIEVDAIIGDGLDIPILAKPNDLLIEIEKELNKTKFPGGKLIKVRGDMFYLSAALLVTHLSDYYGAIALFDMAEEEYIVCYSSNPEYSIGQSIKPETWTVVGRRADGKSIIVEEDSRESCSAFIKRNSALNPEVEHQIILL
jgi:hypothetical protein